MSDVARARASLAGSLALLVVVALSALGDVGMAWGWLAAMGFGFVTWPTYYAARRAVRTRPGWDLTTWNERQDALAEAVERGS